MGRGDLAAIGAEASNCQWLGWGAQPLLASPLPLSLSSSAFYSPIPSISCPCEGSGRVGDRTAELQIITTSVSSAWVTLETVVFQNIPVGNGRGTYVLPLAEMFPLWNVSLAMSACIHEQHLHVNDKLLLALLLFWVACFLKHICPEEVYFFPL